MVLLFNGKQAKVEIEKKPKEATIEVILRLTNDNGDEAIVSFWSDEAKETAHNLIFAACQTDALCKIG